MNDSFEEKLRALKPGALPEPLRQRLSAPPVRRSSASRRIVYAAFGLAAAACLALMLSRLGKEGPLPPASSSMPSFAVDREQRVTGLRSLAVVTDESNQRWKLVEVNWVEEQTLVSASEPLTVQLQNHHRAVVPVAIHFD
jgi:hypothetical protein